MFEPLCLWDRLSVTHTDMHSFHSDTRFFCAENITFLSDKIKHKGSVNGKDCWILNVWVSKRKYQSNFLTQMDLPDVSLCVSFVFSTCNTSQLMWHKNIQLCSRYIFSEMFLYMDYIFFCTHRLGHILHFSCLWFLAVKRSLTKFILSVYEGTMITGLRVTGLTIKTSVKPDRSVNGTKIKLIYIKLTL